ncbi:SDR family NAD(P)-dependent oxidoreductase [Rhizorhabdus histidinilytica]
MTQGSGGDVVLVTGGASGLGAAIARGMHERGFRVGIGDLDAAAAAALAAELDPSGATAIGIALDVREQSSFEAARDTLVARWGSVEGLVNNAAATAAKPVLDITPDEFDAVMAVNARGTFVGSQVFGRVFKAQGYGRIVNLASLAGQNGGTATGAHYAASKGAILTLTKVFARDLAAFGVTANAIAPGPLDRRWFTAPSPKRQCLASWRISRFASSARRRSSPTSSRACAPATPVS